MRMLLIAPIALAFASCAADVSARGSSDEKAMAELDKLLAGYTAGKPESCLETRNLQGPTAYGDSTLIFRDGRRTLWRTEAPGCDDAGRDALITRQFGTRICRGDIGRTADLVAGVQTGSCAFGDFTPYRRN